MSIYLKMNFAVDVDDHISTSLLKIKLVLFSGKDGEEGNQQ